MAEQALDEPVLLQKIVNEQLDDALIGGSVGIHRHDWGHLLLVHDP